MSLRELLTVNHMNSRFIYLVTSLTVCACVAFLAVAFVFTSNQQYFPEMIGILLTGGVGSAASRWLTTNKKQGPGPQPDVETKEITTVEKKKSIKTS